MSLKERIIEKSVLLFNEKGFFNVSIQEIAKSLEISPGNLTYHFPKKEHLLELIQQRIIDRPGKPIMPGDRAPDLRHLEAIFKEFFAVQREFSFFFTNLPYLQHEYPGILSQYEAVSLQRLNEARTLVDAYVRSGWLKYEDDVVNHETLIKNIWISNTFWQLQSALLGGRNEFEEAMYHVWSTLLPYLTDQGLQEYYQINAIQKQKNSNGRT